MYWYYKGLLLNVFLEENESVDQGVEYQRKITRGRWVVADLAQEFIPYPPISSALPAKLNSTTDLADGLYF